MTSECIDHAAGRTRAEGSIFNLETIEIAAELRAMELVEVLKAALAGAPHWRREAQQLLKAIAAGSLPEHLG
jgi:uncharacterized SAM-dependent methyltransferase